MGDMFNKQVDLSGIIKTIQDEVSKIHDVSENAGEAVGEGFNIGMEESAKQIQASSIKLESSFKKLGEKIKKQSQQLSTSIQGNPIKLKIDFSDVDMDSKRIQNRIQKLMEEFDTEELVHYDTKQSRQQFQDLITLSIKYDEKLSLLRKSMQDLKTPQDTLKNLQQQYILVKQIGDIYNFLDKQTDKMLPSKMPSAMFDSYELSSAIKMLSDFTNGVQAAESKMDFSGVVQQLEEIKKIINELKIAFEPLTNAFTDGDNALSKMVTTSITDLDKLIQKFNELYQMVDTISNKQFNVNNIISNGNNTQNDLDQIRQFRKEAKELYSQVQDLYVESATTGNKIKSTPWGFNEVLNFSRIMGDFDFNDLGKRIKSRSAASLAIVVDELAEWKRILLQFNELRNKTEAGSFDSSKYKSTVSKTDNTTTSKKGTESVVDESVIDDNDILNKVKILSEQVMAEFASIRNKMEEVFDFSTLNFNDEFIKSQIEQIYQQFVELQSKINALDFSITSFGIVAPKDPKQDQNNDVAPTQQSKNVNDVLEKAYNKFLNLTGKKSSAIFRGQLDNIAPILESDITLLERFDASVDSIDDSGALKDIVSEFANIKDSITSSVEAVKTFDNVADNSIQVDTTATQNEFKEVTTIVDNYGRELDEVHSKLLGTSKMMNIQGKLITLFHGSESDFDSFDISTSDRHSNNFGQGAYFYDNPSNSIGYGPVSQWFANVEKIFDTETKLSIDEIQTIYEKYKVQIKECFDINNLLDFESWVNKNPVGSLRSLADRLGLPTDNDLLKSLGYDAILNRGSDVNEYIILDESKIIKANSALKEQVSLITDIQEAKRMEENADPKRNFNKSIMDSWRAKQEDSSKTTDSGAEDIRSATEAIKEEGDAAELAAKQKEEFVEANKKVAASGTKTKAGVKEATEAIEEEGEAAEDSTKRIAMVQQANSSFETANKANIGDVVKLRGLSQADFELYAQEVAKSKGLTVDDISVRMGENGNMMLASVRMVNEELAQSITYTYKLMELEEGLTEAYLTGYTAKGNQNKALKIAAAAQKKADAERLKADKAKAKNNQWLIQQQSKLDTQERKYKYSNKSIDGSTSLMSTETSLADGVDKTIDSLTRHIKERIKLAMADGLTDDLKESILNDLRILQNEISVAQSVEYSATNMKASSVETNKKAYAEYLNAFEANAKKANVFGQMEDDIKSLRTELEKVSDSASMDQFIDNLKVARNKLQAEKAQYTAQEKESQAQQKQEQKQLKQLIADYKEYANIIERIQILINKSNLTGEDYSQAIFGLQSSANEKAAKMLNTYGVDVTSQDNLLDSLSNNNILTQEQMNTLLEEDIKHREKIVQLVREASDAETNASNKKYAQEQKNQNKQAQNYGKTQYNRELKYLETINAKATALEKDSGVSKLLNNKIQEYKNVFTRLENLRNTFSSDPKAFNNDRLKNDFQSAALEAENLRKEILGIFKESQKLANIPSDSLLGIKEINDLNLSEAKQEMINFIAEITDGQFKFEGFNAAGTEMYGVLDKGNGIIENVTIALDRGTNSLYAYQTGTKQVSNSWQKLGSTLKEGAMRIAGQYIGFHELFQQIRNGITSVKDIDLALTELKKVTDETDESYKRFLKTASNTSSVIGSTVSEFTNAAADFARLGYTVEESAKMAESAIIYKNVADGLDTIEESTESIISTMMAYGIAANDTMSIIDRFNAVGNAFAITSAGIGEAMQRSASALYAGGNTIDESIALITTANSVVKYVPRCYSNIAT